MLRLPETSLNQQSLLERTRACMEKTALAIDITFLDYRPDLAHHFEAINKQWIEEMFVLEDIDAAVLEDPQTHIINEGGKIWFAEHPSLGIVGACALLNKGDNNYELTKMGVAKGSRGLKVGELLLQHVIHQAQALELKTLFLLTNSKCEAAIHLYEKNGFVHSKAIMQLYGKSYERCNVAMRYIG